MTGKVNSIQFEINPVGNKPISDLRGKNLAKSSQKLQVTGLNSFTCRFVLYMYTHKHTHNDAFLGT